MTTLLAETKLNQVSEMAETLIGSEIIKLANDVNERIRRGETIHNLTIGDFDPAVFPIPQLLLDEIVSAYKSGHTNYPVASGMPELRKAVSQFIKTSQHLDYSPEEILISGGARPLIYGIFKTLVDPGDKVVYPVPSWNNNHYCHLSLAEGVMVETLPANNFMPVAEELAPHISDARMIALCSPLNPTGTVFSKEQLSAICELVLSENKRRAGNQKPLYLLYDQVYGRLTFNNNYHYDPVSLYPSIRNYTVCVDGISKSLAATGLRVGWAFGPRMIIDKMKSILSHVGAWAPRAEQVAVARYLSSPGEPEKFMEQFNREIYQRLSAFYDGFMELKKNHNGVDAIAPQAAMYLTVKFDLSGNQTPDGNKFNIQQDITDYLLDKAKIALVPFSAFGASEQSPWYRLSVGTCRLSDVPVIISNLRHALSVLK